MTVLFFFDLTYKAYTMKKMENKQANLIDRSPPDWHKTFFNVTELKKYVLSTYKKQRQ